jgi:hypothetical protein
LQNPARPEADLVLLEELNVVRAAEAVPGESAAIVET